MIKKCITVELHGGANLISVPGNIVSNCEESQTSTSSTDGIPSNHDPQTFDNHISNFANCAYDSELITSVIGEGVVASPNPVLGWVGSLSYINEDTGLDQDIYPNTLPAGYWVKTANNFDGDRHMLICMYPPYGDWQGEGSIEDDPLIPDCENYYSADECDAVETCGWYSDESICLTTSTVTLTPDPAPNVYGLMIQWINNGQLDIFLSNYDNWEYIVDYGYGNMDDVIDIRDVNLPNTFNTHLHTMYGTLQDTSPDASPSLFTCTGNFSCYDFGTQACDWHSYNGSSGMCPPEYSMEGGQWMDAYSDQGAQNPAQYCLGVSEQGTTTFECRYYWDNQEECELNGCRFAPVIYNEALMSELEVTASWTWAGVCQNFCSGELEAAGSGFSRCVQPDETTGGDPRWPCSWNTHSTRSGCHPNVSADDPGEGSNTDQYTVSDEPYLSCEDAYTEFGICPHTCNWDPIIDETLTLLDQWIVGEYGSVDLGDPTSIPNRLPLTLSYGGGSQTDLETYFNLTLTDGEYDTDGDGITNYIVYDYIDDNYNYINFNATIEDIVENNSGLVDVEGTMIYGCDDTHHHVVVGFNGWSASLLCGTFVGGSLQAEFFTAEGAWTHEDRGRVCCEVQFGNGQPANWESATDWDWIVDQSGSNWPDAIMSGPYIGGSEFDSLWDENEFHAHCCNGPIWEGISSGEGEWEYHIFNYVEGNEYVSPTADNLGWLLGFYGGTAFGQYDNLESWLLTSTEGPGGTPVANIETNFATLIDTYGPTADELGPDWLEGIYQEGVGGTLDTWLLEHYTTDNSETSISALKIENTLDAWLEDQYYSTTVDTLHLNDWLVTRALQSEDGADDHPFNRLSGFLLEYGATAPGTGWDWIALQYEAGELDSWLQDKFSESQFIFEYNLRGLLNKEYQCLCADGTITEYITDEDTCLEFSCQSGNGVWTQVSPGYLDDTWALSYYSGLYDVTPESDNYTFLATIYGTPTSGGYNGFDDLDHWLVTQMGAGDGVSNLDGVSDYVQQNVCTASWCKDDAPAWKDYNLIDEITYTPINVIGGYPTAPNKSIISYPFDSKFYAGLGSVDCNFFKILEESYSEEFTNGDTISTNIGQPTSAYYQANYLPSGWSPTATSADWSALPQGAGFWIQLMTNGTITWQLPEGCE